jgi:predicted HicB family RNase H-like nuclease
MATLTLRLPDDQHQRLKPLAARRGVSLNALLAERSTRADTQAGLSVLDKLDRHFAS